MKSTAGYIYAQASMKEHWYWGSSIFALMRLSALALSEPALTRELNEMNAHFQLPIAYEMDLSLTLVLLFFAVDFLIRIVAKQRADDKVIEHCIHLSKAMQLFTKLSKSEKFNLNNV